MELVEIGHEHERWNEFWEVLNAASRELTGSALLDVNPDIVKDMDVRRSRLRARWGLLLDDALVGVVAALHNAETTPATGRLTVAVAPEHRRRGIGSRLVRHAEDWLRECGSAWVISEADIAVGHEDAQRGAAAFAQLHDYRHQHRDIISEMSLPMETIADVPAGYSVDIAAGEVPAAWREDLAILMEVWWRDQPQGEGPVAERTCTADEVPGHLETNGDDERCWLAVARDDDTGRLAGFSEVSWEDSQPELLHQDATVVARAHRRRGLALALKASAIRRAHRDLPGLQSMLTSNDATNTGMLALNTRLGFRAITETIAWRKTLQG